MALAVALAPPIYLSHYLSFSLLQGIASIMAAITPESVLYITSALQSYCHLPIGPAFVIGFFLVDQALCVYIHDECRRHHPYLAVGPRCLFPGHTAFCLYNFQPMGT